MIPPKRIGIFELDARKRKTMEYGYLYRAKVSLPFAKEKRYLRLWIPESYDFADPKETIVFFAPDGQNLVDRYLTAFGDWHLDRVIRSLGKKGYPEPILAGIDCPKDWMERVNELNPPFPVTASSLEWRSTNPMGHRFLEYIVSDFKPYLAKYLRLGKTGILGSSMGGLLGYYALLAYRNEFSYFQIFSPAMFFYSKEEIVKQLDVFHVEKKGDIRVFLYTGGTDFEADFVEGTFFLKEELEKRGYEKKQLGFSYDKEAIHNEKDWAKHSVEALSFLLKDERK